MTRLRIRLRKESVINVSQLTTLDRAHLAERAGKPVAIYSPASGAGCLWRSLSKEPTECPISGGVEHRWVCLPELPACDLPPANGPITETLLERLGNR